MKKLIVLSVVMLIVGLLAGCWTTPEPVIETEIVDTRALYGVYDLTGYNSSTVNSANCLIKNLNEKVSMPHIKI